MGDKKSKESNFISAVLYLQEEDAGAVVPFLEMLCGVLDRNFKNYEIICVHDDAGGVIKDQINHFKESRDAAVTVIHMGFRQGLEAGMNAGVDLSIGDYVLEFDSAFVDYDEELIMDVYNKCISGYDIVSARVPKTGQRLFSRIFYWIYNRFSNMPYDLASDRFCIISRRAVNRVSSYSRIIPYRKAVYAASGMEFAGISYKPTKEAAGNVRPGMERLNTAADAVILFTGLAYCVSLLFSVAMAVVMFGFGIYTVVSYMGGNGVAAGWAPLMGLVSLGFLSLFILLAFLFKYLEVIVKLIFKRQKYIVQSIEKIN